MMKKLLRIAVLLGTMTIAGAALADDGAQTFVQTGHGHLMDLLKQPASSSRDTQVDKAISEMLDFDELARRAFGNPCHPAVKACTNHWNDLSEAQRTEVTSLLRKLIEKNYRKNLAKTVDFDVAFKGTKELQGESRIRTEAKSKTKPRDPAVQIDYVVRPQPGGFRVVDLVTEGSSLTKNYYDQFHKFMTTPDQGYAHVVKKLNEKIAKKDATKD